MKQTRSNDSLSTGKLMSTRVGAINRKIESAVSVAVSGKKGGMGEVLRLAREREALLAPRTLKQKAIA